MRLDIDEQFSACSACGQMNSNRNDLCSNCGHTIHARSIRIRGAIVMVLGFLLLGGMGYLIILIASIMRHSADPGATTRFNGGPAAAAGIFAILGFVMAFGAFCAVMGGSMLRYGYRKENLKRWVWLFAIIFWLGSLLIGFIDLD